jgi:hypothetical protein
MLCSTEIPAQPQDKAHAAPILYPLLKILLLLRPVSQDQKTEHWSELTGPPTFTPQALA